MNFAPEWWLILTAVLAITNVLFFGALVYLLLVLAGVVKRLEPKVHALTDKVDGIAVKVDGIAKTTQDTLDTVSVNTKSIASSVDAITTLAAGPAKAAGPAVGYAVLAYRIVRFLLSMRSSLIRKKLKP